MHSRTDSCTKQLLFAIKEIKAYTGESRDNSCRYPAWYITGRLTYYSRNWKMITKDRWVLDMVRGYKIKLKATPQQVRKPSPPYYIKEQLNLINKDVKASILRWTGTTNLLRDVRLITGHCLPLFLGTRNRLK